MNTTSLDLKELEAFSAVASTLSFSRAAELLGISQSTVSIRIRNFENRFGQKFFYRNGWQVALTQKGELLNRQINSLFQLLSSIERTITSKSEEEIIRISAGESVFISLFPGLTNSFREMHPEVDFNIEINETMKSISDLRFGMVDVALIGWIKEGIYENEPFNVVEIGEDELVLIVPLEHPLAQFEEATPAEIIKYDYIARRKTSGVQHAVIDMLYNEGFSETDLRVRGVMDNASSVIMAVHKNLGVSIVSKMQTAVAEKMNLVKVLRIKSKLSKRKVYLAYRKGSNPVVDLFVEYVIKYAKEYSNKVAQSA